MAVQVEIWQEFIVKNLFKSNEFLQYLLNRDQYVLAGKVVHIPQAGANPGVTKNPTSFPLTASQRTDSDVTYPLNQYVTDPVHIQDAEKIELSYDKIADVMDHHLSKLREELANDAIYDMVRVFADASAGVARIRTTGDAVVAHLPSATGNRKKFVKEDLKRARFLMNKQSIPMNDRYSLISSDMMEQLQDDADLLKRDSSLELDMKGGVIDRLYGFNLIERATTVAMDNAATPVAKAPGAAGAATDNDTAVCWQRNSAERALGQVKFFERLNDPLYTGDIYNALVRFASRPSRADSKGIIAIVQDASA